MKNKIFKSLSDLSFLKKEANDLDEKIFNADESISNEYDASLNRNIAADGSTKWLPVRKLLSNKLFEEIAWGSVNRITSKNYSVVLAVLTYPTKADTFIRQEHLDKAHDIALRIKSGLKSGRIKYTDPKIPKPWRISGNPGTRK
jgi:hypothetical protein